MDRIKCLVELGKYFLEEDERLKAHLSRTYHHNNWFTVENQLLAIRAIAHEFLEENKLRNWAKNYSIENNSTPKRIGIIPAANIPLVWFHDVLSIFISGNISVIKLSERDPYILPFLVKKMEEIQKGSSFLFEFVSNLKVDDLDAIITTGSNNSSRYFEYYFNKIPNIIRKNRTSISVLDGSENQEELLLLANDIMQYFGLGCRNVSKVYVPRDYDFNNLLEAIHTFKNFANHSKYRNNFDYQFSLIILNKIVHYNNGCILLIENEKLQSPLAVLNYEFYDDYGKLVTSLNAKKEEIQCVVSEMNISGFDTKRLGDAQKPTLFDYADGVDTMDFLQKL